MNKLFENREDAGKKLAQYLMHLKGQKDVMVLALPRGGVPVGYEVSRALDVPLDVFVVRKLGAPGQPELAMGAIASHGQRIINTEVVKELRVSEAQIEVVVQREQQEVPRRENLYRQGRPQLDISGKKIVLVDDGLATGSSMLAAVQAVRNENPLSVIVAVPVAPVSVVEHFKSVVDEMITVYSPQPFMAIGLWYEDFIQTTDAQVQHLLSMRQKELAHHS